MPATDHLARNIAIRLAEALDADVSGLLRRRRTKLAIGVTFTGWAGARIANWRWKYEPYHFKRDWGYEISCYMGPHDHAPNAPTVWRMTLYVPGHSEFELTALPWELFLATDWLARMMRALEGNPSMEFERIAKEAGECNVPLNCSSGIPGNYVWTVAAEAVYDAYLKDKKEREERRRQAARLKRNLAINVS